MEEVDAIIAQARRAFSKRRREIGTTLDPHLQPMAMQDQIHQEMAIVRQLLTLMAPSASVVSSRSALRHIARDPMMERAEASSLMKRSRNSR